MYLPQKHPRSNRNLLFGACCIRCTSDLIHLIGCYYAAHQTVPCRDRSLLRHRPTRRRFNPGAVAVSPLLVGRSRRVDKFLAHQYSCVHSTTLFSSRLTPVQLVEGAAQRVPNCWHRPEAALTHRKTSLAAREEEVGMYM